LKILLHILTLGQRVCIIFSNEVDWLVKIGQSLKILLHILILGQRVCIIYSDGVDWFIFRIFLIIVSQRTPIS
jgi:hypothetical protein